MRPATCLHVILLAACLNPLAVHAQPTADERTEPYRKHRDVRYGHDHTYPDRGAVIRDLPSGAVIVNYAGITFRFDGGVWYEPRGPAYIVVDPPIGLIVPALPGFTTPVVHAGETYMYANNVYYRARPELGGYEVVNEPADAQPADKVATSGNAGPSAAALGGAAAIAAPTSANSAAPVAAVPAVAAAVPGAALAAQPVTPVSPAQSTTPSAGSTSTGSTVAGSTSAVPTSTGTLQNSAPLTVGQSSPPPTVPISASPAGTGSIAAPLPAAGAPAPAGAATALSAGSVAAPAITQSSASPPPVPQIGPRVFIYPRSGQNTDQQAHDRYECYRFAVAQSGYDPIHLGAAAQTQRAEQQSDYERAQAACLEGRGYSVR